MSKHINNISIFHGVSNIIGGLKYDTSAACKFKAMIGFRRHIFILTLVYHILLSNFISIRFVVA